MQSAPLTDEQEGILRRWASTIKKRPKKQEKAFLQEEKGLSENQIDTWFKQRSQSTASSKSNIGT